MRVKFISWYLCLNLLILRCFFFKNVLGHVVGTLWYVKIVAFKESRKVNKERQMEWEDRWNQISATIPTTMMAGYTHNLSVDTHHDLCLLCVSLCAPLLCTTAVYNKIWAWSRQMGRTMPVSQCYRADLKRKIFWCLLGEATPTEVTLSLVTGATMQSGTLQLAGSVAKLHKMCSAAMCTLPQSITMCHPPLWTVTVVVEICLPPICKPVSHL